MVHDDMSVDRIGLWSCCV